MVRSLVYVCRLILPIDIFLSIVELHETMTKILVTGGTGVLGQAVSKALASQQIDFLIGSRSQAAKHYDQTGPRSNVVHR